MHNFNRIAKIFILIIFLFNQAVSYSAEPSSEEIGRSSVFSLQFIKSLFSKFNTRAISSPTFQEESTNLLPHTEISTPLLTKRPANIDSAIPLISSQNLFLLHKLIKLQNYMKSSKNVEEFIISTDNLNDLYLIKSAKEINNFNRTFQLTYYQLKDNFNLAKESIEKEITLHKLENLGFSPRISFYLSRVFTYRLLKKDPANNEDLEYNLIQAEKFLEKDEINLFIHHLNHFTDFKELKNCQQDFSEYFRITLLIDNLIDYICNFKEVK